MSERRWLGPTVILVGVALIATGIAEMLRVSYVQHPHWTLVILPVGQVLLGSAFLLVPLLRRLAREPADEEDSDRRPGGRDRPSQPR